MLYQTFDQLLQLPEGTLQPASGAWNQSLPYPEVEMIRHFMAAYRANGGREGELMRVVRRRVTGQLVDPDRFSFPSHRIVAPQWAADAANELGAQWATALENSPVSVVGDVAHLQVDPEKFPQNTAQPQMVSTESAAQIAFQSYSASRKYFGQQRSRSSRKKAEIPLRDVDAETPSAVRSVGRTGARGRSGVVRSVQRAQRRSRSAARSLLTRARRQG